MPHTLETPPQATAGESVSPLAGKPAPKELLIDVSRMEKEYYEHKPDLSRKRSRRRERKRVPVPEVQP